MVFWVYILRSLQGSKYYVGQSEDPDRRLYYHNTVEKGFTSRYRPWELVWRKAYPTRSEAKKIEGMIKSWKNKILIKELIAGKRTV